MVQLIAWDFNLPSVVDALNNATFTAAEQEVIDSHISLLERTYVVHATIATISTALAVTMLCLTLSRAWEIKHGVTQGGLHDPTASTSLPKNVTQLLIFNTFGVLAPSFALLTYTGIIDAHNSLGCDLMWKMCVTFYIVAMHMSYWILLGRAGAVLDVSFFRDNHRTQKLRWFVHKATYAFYLAYPLPVSHLSTYTLVLVLYSSRPTSIGPSHCRACRGHSSPH
jgi:hypothetical protein